jgi:hypothetical protein
MTIHTPIESPCRVDRKYVVIPGSKNLKKTPQNSYFLTFDCGGSWDPVDITFDKI